MFNPFDASNHSGLLTGMTRVHTGAQDSVERGALAGPAVMKAGTFDVLGAGAAIQAKLDLSADTLVAAQKYMQGAFQPPTAASSDVEKKMFVAATQMARSNKQVAAFMQDLAVLLQLRANLVLAEKERDTLQAFADNAPAMISAMEINYQAAFNELADAGIAADDAFDNFVGYIKDSVNLILRNYKSWVRGWDTIGKFPDGQVSGIFAYNALYATYPIFVTDRWTPTVGTFVAETVAAVAAVAIIVTAIVLTAGAAGAAGAAAAEVGAAEAGATFGASTLGAGAGGASLTGGLLGSTAVGSGVTLTSVGAGAGLSSGLALTSVGLGTAAVGTTGITISIAAPAAVPALVAGAGWSATGIAFAALGSGAALTGFSVGASTGIEALRAKLSDALWAFQGTITKSDMQDIFGQQPYYSGGPALQPLPKTNPPLRWNGKSISGVNVSKDGRQYWCSARRGWSFSPHPTAGTRLRYIGGEADAEPHLQGFLATNRWNAAFLSAVNKMAEIWPVVNDLSNKIGTMKTELAGASARIQQSDLIKAQMQKDLKKGLAELDGKYKFSGFYAGYVDVLKNEALDVADILGQITTLGTLQDQVSDVLSKADKFLNDANFMISGFGSITDPTVLTAKTAQVKATIDSAKSVLQMADKLRVQGEDSISKINTAAARVSGWDQMGVALPKVLKDKVGETVKKAQAAADSFKSKEAEIDAAQAKANELEGRLVPKPPPGVPGTGAGAGGGEVTTGAVTGGTAALAIVGGLAAILALRK